MGRLLLICRLAVGDVRHRPASAVLLVLAIVTAATTLTLGLALAGTSNQPYQQTRALTAGPDVVAEVQIPPKVRVAFRFREARPPMWRRLRR